MGLGFSRVNLTLFFILQRREVGRFIILVSAIVLEFGMIETIFMIPF